MKMPDEIKKGLECCACERVKNCPDCPYLETECEGEYLAGDALAYIQQLEEQVPRWISTADALPEDDDKCVLVIATGHMKNCVFVDALMLAHYCPDEGWIIEGWEEWENPTVSHWMPLPEPPEAE